ncbi:hypothetical protein ACFLSI_01670 [Bacteroidota bacterium]
MIARINNKIAIHLNLISKNGILNRLAGIFFDDLAILINNYGRTTSIKEFFCAFDQKDLPGLIICSMKILIFKIS